MTKNVLPSSTQAEASIISTLLSGSREIAGDIFDALADADFYMPINQAIFEAARKVYRDGAEIDAILVAEYLLPNWNLNEHPAVYLARILDTQPVAVSVEQYCQRIKDASCRRNLISLCGKMIQRCQNETDAIDILEAAQTGIMGLSLQNGRSEYYRLPQLIESAVDRYDALANNACDFTGIPTGFDVLDYITCGWQKTDSIYIAAQTSMGKTSLMVSMICNHIMAGRSVGVFSMEMSRDQITDRIMSVVTDINLMRFRSGKFRTGDMDIITHEAEILNEKKLAVDDTGGISVEEISRKAKMMVARDKIEILYIDYLGLIQAPKSAKSVVEGISFITRRLKLLAKELNIPIVCLCQLNRKLAERSNKRPILSDLRDSGSIEQDADVVIFIYRDEVYNEQSPKAGTAEIIVAKQRNGPTGSVEIGWAKNSARFENLP